MKLHYRIVALTLGLLCSAAVFAGTAADAITVTDPYVPALPPGQPNSLAYMGLTNNSDQDIELVAAEGAVSKVVELHTHVMKDGMMNMITIPKIDLPAGKTVMLEPNGLHVMLIGLINDLKDGDNVALTLVFKDGSKKAVDVPVRKIMMKMEKQKGDGHNHNH
jgi:copper(I)-binding protein